MAALLGCVGLWLRLPEPAVPGGTPNCVTRSPRPWLLVESELGWQRWGSRRALGARGLWEGGGIIGRHPFASGPCPMVRASPISPAAQPQLRVTHYPAKTQKSSKPTARAFRYFGFFPLFLVFALPLALEKGFLLQPGPDQAALARLWLAGLASTEPALARLGVPVAPCSPTVFICFVASRTSEAGEGNPAHLPVGWLVSGGGGGGGEQRVALCGVPSAGRGISPTPPTSTPTPPPLPRPSPLFTQHWRAGYKRLPVKMSFGTSIPERAFAKEKYCCEALGKQRYSSRGK